MTPSPRRLAFPHALAATVPVAAPASDAPDPPADSVPGLFFGTLPLAGCAGADVLLELGGDHRYALQAHCRATLVDLPVERGQWSLEWNGTCVRLVPEGALPGAGPRPREFALALDDLMVLTEGSCIEPVDDPRGRSLHRAHEVE